MLSYSRYLLPCIVALGCQPKISSDQAFHAQGSVVPTLQFATTRPRTSVYGLDSLRGKVVQEAAPEGSASSPAWVWQDPQPVAVWGSLGDYTWVYPLAQDATGQPTLESMALARYALATDLQLVPSSSLGSRQPLPVASSALYLPAQSATCPRHLLVQQRLVPQGLVRSDQETPLQSRGATGNYLVYQSIDGHTELVSSSCGHLVGPWTYTQEELVEERPQGSWRNGRSSELLLETLVGHRYGEEMLVEAPEELPDLGLRPPLCQSPYPQRDAPAIRLYSAESFVLQVLAKLPVVLRQELQPYWQDVLNTPLGREWLEHFEQIQGDAAIDSGMLSLQSCNEHAAPLQLATNLAALRTSTSRNGVTKTRLQLQHPAFESRLLEATQLLNEAARRYEMADSNHPAYRFHRKRGLDAGGIAFQLLHFDGKQSLATQTVPGIPNTLVFSKARPFAGLARNYEQREYLVNLDAARLVDMLENKLQVAMQAREATNTAEWSAADLLAITSTPREKVAFKENPTWMAGLVDAVHEAFNRTPLANDYELRVTGLTSQTAMTYFYLAHMRQVADPEFRAKDAWRKLLVSRLAGKPPKIVLGIATVEDGWPRFEEELYSQVEACGRAFGFMELRRYLTFKKSPPEWAGPLVYLIYLNFKQLYSDTRIPFETAYNACMPLLEDPAL
jgi:hypothetical protein